MKTLTRTLTLTLTPRLLAAIVALPVPAVCGGDDHTNRVLVFSRTAGYRHGSIPTGIEMFRELGLEHEFEVEATEESSIFVDAKLDRFDAVVFLNTTGDVLDDEQQQAFERFIRSGHGYLGVHAAADTEYDWPWYGALVGAWFKGHPAVQPALVAVTDRTHPATRHLPPRWTRTDEWYDYRASPRGDVHVVASIDEGSYTGGGMGADHPIAWCHLFDGGRAFYTGGGHTHEAFGEPLFRQHLLGAVRWTAGWDDGDAGATSDRHYERVVLDDAVTDPMELAVAPDGRVIFVERGGAVKIWRPDTRSTVQAGILDVFTELEDGLLGIALDPRFATNGHVYLYYAPAGTRPVNRLSRFTLAGNDLALDSEIVMLDVPVQRDECCHSGGSIAFDADGNLYLSTGDNTSPFASDGYAPIDGRPGRGPFDARKSSASTHDLRGKILRIHPEDDGTYTIPDGNLFARPDDGRGEIYIMGCRNPFRISVDGLTGTVYWGDVGPDASSPRAGRGPAGYDEFNRAMHAGNFGWPLLIADNRPYHAYDFATGVSGDMFDSGAPINESPNRIGRRVLPPAQPAWLWYRYEASEQFPQLGAGGRCAMAGPVYRPAASMNHPQRLPSALGGALFIYEWARDWIRLVHFDDAGEILAIDPFLPGLDLTRPMDMEIGPDGCLYLIEWGTGFGGGNPDALVSRIEHYPTGRRPPRAIADATATSGSVPLSIRFDASASHPRGVADGTLNYAWDLDGDGSIDSTSARPSMTYRTTGVADVQLTVTDAYGLTSTDNVRITAGNSAPTVTIAWPPHGGICAFGSTVTYRIDVADLDDDRIDPLRVTVQPALGHDTHAHPLRREHGTEGRIRTLRDDGHGADADLFTVVTAAYTDTGHGRAPPLSARHEVILQPARKQAEYFTTASDGTRLEKTASPDGQGQTVVFERDGAFIRFAPVNLHRIGAIDLHVASAATGARLELRVDQPDGPLLGTVEPDDGGSIVLDAGPHPIRVEYFERGGGAGLVLRWAGPGVERQIVPPAALSHGADAGLIATYFDLSDPDRLPDFKSLTATSSGVVRHLAFASKGGDFAGSERADNLGAVFSGTIDLPASGQWAFWLESDDGSRLYLDDRLIVENDGLHGMLDTALALSWQTIRAPIRDPGGTRDLIVVCRMPQSPSGLVKLDWLNFSGPGVANPASRRSGAHDSAH